MRHEILRMLENNSRIDLHDLAIMLGTDESVVLEEIEKWRMRESSADILPLLTGINRHRESNSIYRSACYPTERTGI